MRVEFVYLCTICFGSYIACSRYLFKEVDSFQDWVNWNKQVITDVAISFSWLLLAEEFYLVLVITIFAQTISLAASFFSPKPTKICDEVAKCSTCQYYGNSYLRCSIHPYSGYPNEREKQMIRSCPDYSPISQSFVISERSIRRSNLLAKSYWVVSILNKLPILTEVVLNNRILLLLYVAVSLPWVFRSIGLAITAGKQIKTYNIQSRVIMCLAFAITSVVGCTSIGLIGHPFPTLAKVLGVLYLLPIFVVVSSLSPVDPDPEQKVNLKQMVPLYYSITSTLSIIHFANVVSL